MENIKYFGNYDFETGEYKGFYPTDVWDEDQIPTPKIEITYDDWQTALRYPGRSKVVNGQNVYSPFTQEDIDTRELNIVRSERDLLLKESDWTQLPNSPLTTQKVEEWATYRQELRDVTNSKPYVFPTPPQK
jgi:hypothetical protein